MLAFGRGRDMTEFDPLQMTRRHFLGSASLGLGALGLAESGVQAAGIPRKAAKAKRVIYLFQSGGPAHIDLYDEKPLLRKEHGNQLPSSVIGRQRLTAMSGNQASLPMAGSAFDFADYGKSKMRMSSLLPNIGGVADDICLVRSMWTEAINHDPAMTFFQTGSQIAGRPSMGAWVGYGLGSMNKDLPGFVVLVTKGQGDQPLYARLWGSGFLDSRYQGVPFRAGKDPVLYLKNPEGVSATSRRNVLDTLGVLQRQQSKVSSDPEVDARLAQYELAFRMQTSVPEVTDLSSEPAETFELYGEDARTAGTFAANCVLARRLAEKGVRFIQLYHQGWDHHGDLPGNARYQAKLTDKASAALIIDLKRRGLLDDTLVIWGGEFGRTAYSQGAISKDNYGRDHHPRCFSLWMAGAGMKRGFSYGRTDDYGYNLLDKSGNVITPSKDKFVPGVVHVHDLQATILDQLGIDHHQLTYRNQGRDYRLTDVHGHVVTDLLS